MFTSAIRIAIVLASTAITAQLGYAGQGTWTSGGPYGGDVMAVAIDPSAPGTVYTARTAAGSSNPPTPAIGGDASGPNFGWALTPKVNGAATCRIPSNGVQVSIDSGPLQPVVYGDARTDIAGAFPGFSNSAGAGGHFIVDWSTLAPGMHTIGWLITDDCNRADGVGSRFFNVPAGGSAVTAEPGEFRLKAETRPDAAFRLQAEATLPNSVVSAFRRNAAEGEVFASSPNEDAGPVLVAAMVSSRRS